MGGALPPALRHDTAPLPEHGGAGGGVGLHTALQGVHRVAAARDTDTRRKGKCKQTPQPPRGVVP